MKYKNTDKGLAIENQYPKLVRDKIPEIVKSHGKKADIRVLTKNEDYIEYLLAKLIEEASELAKSKTKDKLIEELADIMEVVEAILEIKSLTPADVALIQEKKRLDRGGFKKRLLMLKRP